MGPPKIESVAVPGAQGEHEQVDEQHEPPRHRVGLWRVRGEVPVVEQEPRDRDGVQRREDQPEVADLGPHVRLSHQGLEQCGVHRGAEVHADQAADDAVEERVAHVDGFPIGRRDRADVAVVLRMGGHLADREHRDAEHEDPGVGREGQAHESQRADHESADHCRQRLQVLDDTADDHLQQDDGAGVDDRDVLGVEGEVDARARRRTALTGVLSMKSRRK